LIVEFIDEHRTTFGVEPICRELQVAPSTYYAAKTRPPSARARRDIWLKTVISEIFVANYSVYGARKMHKALQRAGHDIGRDQTARLMRELGLQGARRGRRRVTTRPDARACRPPDLVDRHFDPTEPNRLWVLDITYVPTWAHVTYVCFIIDAFARRIIGWRVATNMRTDMVLDALEMAAWARGTQLDGLVCHSDAGSQFTSVRFGERLDELGAVPSIGSVGDSYDNALAETVFGLYKTELIRPRGPWRNVDAVELATLRWVDWFNNQRLHSHLDDRPPAEFEAAYIANTTSDQLVGTQ
jgi:putative transposase